MTLTFTQENGLYVAEFEASAPFSIHLERPKGGFINMLQRSVDSGTYVAVKNFNPNYNATQVIDADCGSGAVYPKWIRLESAVEPSVAEVTFESESGGGAGTAEYVNDLITEYWAIDWDKARELGYDGTETDPVSFSMMLKVLIATGSIGRAEINGSPFVIGYPSQYCLLGVPTYVSSIGFIKLKGWDVDNGWVDFNSFQDVILSLQGNYNMSEIFIPITKEEFYQGVEEA